MTSRPLKASHIKTEVKKKLEAAKRYTLRQAGYLQAASPYTFTLIVVRNTNMNQTKQNR